MPAQIGGAFRRSDVVSVWCPSPLNTAHSLCLSGHSCGVLCAFFSLSLSVWASVPLQKFLSLWLVPVSLCVLWCCLVVVCL